MKLKSNKSPGKYRGGLYLEYELYTKLQILREQYDYTSLNALIVDMLNKAIEMVDEEDMS